MKTSTKIAIVAGGYVAALVLALLAAVLRNVFAPSPDPSGGMAAFGDGMLVFGVFGVIATIPTGLALYFLRPYRAFWNIISGLSVAVALTSVVAAFLYAFGRQATAPSPIALLAGISVLRMLIAPVFALMFLLCAALSSYRVPRLTFVAATILEAAVTGYVGFVLFLPMLLNAHS